MRRILVAAGLALILLPGWAGAAEIGIGAFGGASVPILNDLSKQGSTFGVRVPVSLVPFLTLEPFYAASALGDVSEDFGTSVTYKRDGGDVKAFGVSALLPFGSPMFKLYPFAGVGSYKITRNGAEDLTKTGYNFGLGLGISPIPKLTVHVRGEMSMVATDQTSQKFANITGGLSYSLISVP
jgi:opacity protein-like surface antigen